MDTDHEVGEESEEGADGWMSPGNETNRPAMLSDLRFQSSFIAKENILPNLCLKMALNLQVTTSNQLIWSLRSVATFKCDKQGHARMHPTHPTSWTTHRGYLQG